MDLGILFGFIGTWVLIFWALLAGGRIDIYFDVPSMILVAGTTITVLFFAFPMRNMKGMISVLRKAFSKDAMKIDQLIEELVSYAEIARRDGILSLENAAKDIEDPFIVRGIQMAVDGTDPELIEQVMSNELDSLVERHATGKALFDAVGKFAPAFGMIGTIVGLVAMLANMDDPSAIGAGMAVALITTLYGAVIANAIAIPIADRLAQRSNDEVLYKTVIIKGVMSIQSGDNPRSVEQKLRAFLSPAQRPDASMREAA